MMKKLLLVFCVFFSVGGNAQTWTNFASKYLVRSIATEENIVWVCSTNGISKRDLDGNILNEYTTIDGLVDNDVRCMAIDKHRNKWFGTHNGVSKFDGVTWTSYKKSNSGYNIVNSIVIDVDGNKWIGTDSNGASKFNDTTWTSYAPYNSGLAYFSLNAIATDKQGIGWFGTDGYGVSEFNRSSWATYTDYNSGLANNTVNTIAIDSFGIKWFGTFGAGVSKFDGKNWTSYNKYNVHLASNNITSIVIDSEGIKWIGTFDGGVSKFNDSTSINYNTSNSGIASNWINAIAIDIQGNKWFATYTGISKLSEGIASEIINSRIFSNKSATIFPNPAKDEFTIVFPQSGTYEISLANIQGKSIKTWNEIVGQETTLSVEGLEPGMYLYTARGRNGQKYMGKLVVSR